MSAIGQQRVLGHLESDSATEKIEVIGRQTAEDAPTIEIRSLRWGSGVGWYTQKTLALTPGQATQLAHLLRRYSSAHSVRSNRAKVIPLRKPVR